MRSCASVCRAGGLPWRAGKTATHEHRLLHSLGFEMGDGGGHEGRQAWPPLQKGKAPWKSAAIRQGRNVWAEIKPLGKGRARCGAWGLAGGRARMGIRCEKVRRRGGWRGGCGWEVEGAWEGIWVGGGLGGDVVGRGADVDGGGLGGCEVKPGSAAGQWRAAAEGGMGAQARGRAGGGVVGQRAAGRPQGML